VVLVPDDDEMSVFPATLTPYIYLSTRFYNSCRRLPETKRHSTPYIRDEATSRRQWPRINCNRPCNRRLFWW